jgi:4-amino-4-deoxy-L-arabinose transferase-like glycosyltransferase
MSNDYEMLFKDPGKLSWQPDKSNDPKQRYRLLDAPITRYLIGIGRVIIGQEALQVDWDWTASWQANLESGAYPGKTLLQAGRLLITLLLPLSLSLIFLIGGQIGGRTTGLISLVILGINPVVLLHGRRAMAEGPLLFGVLLASWTILKAHHKPWLVGFGMAFAFNAKHSSLSLLPVAILALAWLPKDEKNKFRKVLGNLIQFSLVFIILTVILNPVMWSHPVDALRSAIDSRSELALAQIEDNQTIAPEKSINSPVQRAFVLLLNLFISPPEYGLIENLKPTQNDVDAYIAISGHNLFRGIIWGGIFIVLTFFGIISAIRSVSFKQLHYHRNTLLLLLTTISMTGGLLVAIQIYWIRYTIPLIPFICLWIAYGISKPLKTDRVIGNLP